MPGEAHTERQKMARQDDRSSEWAQFEADKKHWLNERDQCKKLITSYLAQHGHPPEDKLQELEKIDQELKRIAQQERPILRQMKRS